jgi:hypothetical protein
MFTELKRKVSIVSITEEGLYHEGELPSDYDGAYLDIEVVHSIMFIDEGGNFQTFLCAAPVAKNSAKAETPYAISKMKMIEAPTGTSYADTSSDTYTHFLSEELKTKMNNKVEEIKTLTAFRVIPI